MSAAPRLVDAFALTGAKVLPDRLGAGECDAGAPPAGALGTKSRQSCQTAPGGASEWFASLEYDEQIRLLGAVGNWSTTSEGRTAIARRDREEQEQARRDAAREKKEERFELQRALRPLLPPSMWKCRRVRRTTDVEVHVGADGQTWTEGLATCNRRSGCVHCGPRLLARDAELITAMVEKHGVDRTLMLSLTIRHVAGDRLEPMRKGLARAFRKLQTQRRWREMMRGERKIRALEVTFGENGPHPHLHVLLLMPERVSEEESTRMWRELAPLWQAVVTRELGAQHRPALGVGTDLRVCHRADYIAKLGFELADAGQDKRGRGKSRSFFQVASDWKANGCDPSDADAHVIREYFDGMHGAKIVTWDHGMSEEAEALVPKAKAETRELAVIHSEEWDASRDLCIDGRDARIVILRAAEDAEEGRLQEAIDAEVNRILRVGVPFWKLQRPANVDTG